MNGLSRAKNATHESHRVSSMSTCFEGTREGVFTKITEWIEGSDSKCVFWLNGMAGVGKTTIARTVVEKIKRDVWVASFFFSRDDADASDSLLVFPTIAHQLASHHHSIRTALAEMIRENADCAAHPLNKQFIEFIIGPLKALCDSNRTVLLVLDALDECASGKGASEILQLFLVHASSIPCNLRIFITSRPEDHIRSVLDDSRNHTKVVLHDIEKTIVRDDIERFVRHELENIFKGLRLPMPNDSDVKKLAEKADNLFVYAATAIRFIGNKKVCDPQSQLEFILGNRHEIGIRPYSAIDSLYLQVLDAAVPMDDDSFPTIKAQCLNIVGAVVTLRDPLCLSALAALIGSTSHKTENALNSLHSLILVPSSPDEALRVFHPSFIDFITNKTRCDDARFFIDVPKQERYLAHRCIEIMTKSLRQNMAGIEDHTMLNNEVTNFEERVLQVLPAELKYACLYWTSHMLAVECVEHDTESLLSKFLHERLLNWMEAMCLLKAVPQAIVMMRDGHAWAVSGH